MDEINDGGPAFPQSISVSYEPIPSCAGMTLRDWFAGQALAGITSSLAGKDIMRSIVELAAEHDAEDIGVTIARSAFEYADSMIKQRDTSGR